MWRIIYGRVWPIFGIQRERARDDVCFGCRWPACRLQTTIGGYESGAVRPLCRMRCNELHFTASPCVVYMLYRTMMRSVRMLGGCKRSACRARVHACAGRKTGIQYRAQQQW